MNNIKNTESIEVLSSRTYRITLYNKFKKRILMIIVCIIAIIILLISVLGYAISGTF